MNSSSRFDAVISRMLATPALAEAAKEIVQALKADETANSSVQTWGYHPSEGARIFDLKEGESLPKGWFDAPVKEAVNTKDGSKDLELKA